MDYQYSIIIPHYNIPHLLKRCLWSIPKRNDTQIIVVDDRSNDDNLKMLMSIEEEYNYVEFIYSADNGGGGKARNIGLQHAKGKYVLFADADDFFNYCIRDILDEYKNESYDVVYFNATPIDTETYLPSKKETGLQQALRMYKKDGNLDAFRYAFGEPWCKLIKRDIIEKNHIKFDEIPVHNDTKFSYLIGYYAQQLKFDNRAIYCWANRSGSVSKKPNEEKYVIRMRVFAEKNRFLIEHGIDYYDKLMIKPLWMFYKQGDWSHFSECVQIAREYGFGRLSILRKLFGFMLLSIKRDVGKKVKLCVRSVF